MKPMLLGLCLVTIIELVITKGKTPTNFTNEKCEEGNIGIGLEFNVYQESCPEAEAIIFSWVETAISQDPRMAASLLRLHFHDCFVNGCDGSVLLDDTVNFVGEKTAPPNLNSLRGFEVIDAIKSELESVCPETVSCADILAFVARDSVVISGGPGWDVETGRKDSLSASKAAATASIPSPNSTVPALIASFNNVGLSLNDMVALSGGHTIGEARCPTFSARLQPLGAPDVNLDFIQSLQQLCSLPNSNSIIAHLDLVTPATFDNQYFINLVSGQGLLPSDHTLIADDDQTRQIVLAYAQDPLLFFEDFKNSMLRMGSIRPNSGATGEIRRNCRVVNSLF